MDNFVRRFFSMGMMTLGLFLFLAAIGTATLMESVYDTQTSKLYIYNALWFELLLVYLGTSLIVNIAKYRMIQERKWASLIFHCSFLIILIGAGITRYFSFEGSMQIPEGKEVNFIFSSEPHVWLRANDGKMQYVYDEKVYLSEYKAWNDFDHDIVFPGHKNDVEVEYVDFQKNMIDSLVIDKSIKTSALEFVRAGKSEYVTEGGFIFWDELAVSFEKSDAMPGLQFERQGGKILMRSALGATALPMSELQKMDRNNPQIADSLYRKIPLDTLVPLEKATLYAVGEVQFVFKDLKRNAGIKRMRAAKKNEGADYLTLKLTDGDQTKVVTLKGGIQAIPEKEVFEFNGLTYEMEYGAKRIQLPFSVQCNDFQLDRYPGSESASSFASEVTIIDAEKGYEDKRRIFMNNVTDYRGYRFFQSSYFPDESGTVLSVNHDAAGTIVTYIGYLIMTIGMMLSLFVSNGRFRELGGKLNKLAEKRRQLLSVLLVLVSFGINAQDEPTPHSKHDGHNHGSSMPVATRFEVISEAHSDELATLLVQDFHGRIIPMHTMCDEILRKIHRGNTYGDLNAVQTVLSMHMYPDHWLEEKIIYVSSKGGWREKFNNESYVSLNDLTERTTGEFVFAEEYKKAHRMLESKRGEYEKQLIKLVEKYQVAWEVFTWKRMRIIPVKGEPNNTWFDPIQYGRMQLDSSASMMLVSYFSEVDDAAQSGNYAKATKVLEKIKAYQEEMGGKFIPSESAVNMEVRYNKMNIFKNSWMMYLTLGFVLMVLFFVRIFVKPRPVYKRIAQVIGGLMLLVFVYHGAGIFMRGYITGRAPWSNGYEAVVFISWATMAFGFFFSRKNAAILAGTAVLSFFMIFVTEMNLMDPDITPLQPVLKSYWLMIHVAIITASYAPLGIGCILGFMNLLLYILRNTKNREIVTININELTYISEMLLTIGVFMLTIGTFLGGIWANESWGRYWGWDPKETWALVAVLVYAVILHLRFIPKAKSKFIFNVVSFWGYASIIFTFFGVNFYLVGLHSYAQGEGLGEIPNWVIWFIICAYIFTEFSAIRNKLFRTENGAIPIKYFVSKLVVFFVVTLITILVALLLGLTSSSVAFGFLGKVMLIVAATNVLMLLYASITKRKNPSIN